MELYDTIAGAVRSELNHIYTEKPFRTPDGCDFGWFCREHALQLGALLGCRGYPTTLCTGDVFVRVPGEVVISTVGSGDDHAWCTSGSLTPIDASITLKHLGVSCSDIDLVCSRVEYLAGFSLRYFQELSDSNFMQVANTGDKVVAYNEKVRIAAPMSTVLQDPFTFLRRGSPSLLDLYGPDVLFGITAHLLKLTRGEAK